jgi:primary-amine oxidase
VRQFVATQTPIKAFKYIGAEIVLPPKRDVLAHLGIRTEPGAEPGPFVDITRKADVDIIDAVSGYEIFLPLPTALLTSPLSYSWIIHLTRTDDTWVVDSSEKLPEGTMPQLSVYELIEAEQIVRNDERVQKLAADVGEYNTSVAVCTILL